MMDNNIIVLIVVAYLLTILFSNYYLKRLLLEKGWNRDGVLNFVIFVPILNIIWGIGALIDYKKSNMKKKDTPTP